MNGYVTKFGNSAKNICKKLKLLKYKWLKDYNSCYNCCLALP